MHNYIEIHCYTGIIWMVPGVLPCDEEHVSIQHDVRYILN